MNSDRTAFDWEDVQKLPGIPQWSSTPIDTMVDELLKLVQDGKIKGHVGMHVQGIAYGIAHYARHMEGKHQQWAEAKAFQRTQAMVSQGVQDGLEAWRVSESRKRKRAHRDSDVDISRLELRAIS